MVLYTIQILFPKKDSGINNYIKILKRQHSRKTLVRELAKMESDKMILKNLSPVVYL